MKLVLMDSYLSILSLRKLQEQEVRLVNGLKRYIKAKEGDGIEVTEYLKQLLQDAEDEIIQNRTCDNPIDAFHLLKRWVVDWEKCFEIIFCPNCESDDAQIDFSLSRAIVKKHLKVLPFKVDLERTISMIFRLQEVYKFDMTDFVHGRIFKFETKPFTTEEVLYIANKAEDMKEVFNSIRLLEILHEEMKKGYFQDKNIFPVNIAKITAAAYNRNDMPWKSLEILQEYIDADPENRKLKADIEYYTKRAAAVPKSSENTNLERKEEDSDELKDKFNLSVEDINTFHEICGGHLKTEEKTSPLFCYFKETLFPMYRVKTELLNRQPSLFLFHDVINDNEIVLLKNYSLKELQRSQVLKGTTVTVDRFRISESAWLNELDNLQLERLTRRINLITGLETEYKSLLSNSEEYQVLSYGIGGQYRPHNDSLGSTLKHFDPKEVKGTGDRIATFMFYLSDVLYGGATAFPLLKKRVPVVKGGAAFWYNLDLKGEPDRNMLHGGCPVLVGSKWVINKWIRELGQTFSRPCGQKKKSKDKRL